MNISIEEFCSMTDKTKSKIYFDLPTIQRGFVWKPHQIEDLWDSLARNFPIGTFIVDDSSNNIQILDGQQRASAIAIGYYIKTFNLNNDFRRLFVDIAKPDPETDKKFTFRMITRSHPWGYQLKDNEKTLTVADRRNALTVFNKKGIIKEEKYYNVENKENFFPYDCCLPVPVELFLHKNLDKVEKWLIKNFGNYITIENNEIKIKPIIFLEYYEKEKKKNEEGNNKFVRKLKVPTKGLSEIYEKNIYEKNSKEKNYKKEFQKKRLDENKLNQEIEDLFNALNEKLEFSLEGQEISNDNYPHFHKLNELYEAIQAIKNYQLIFSTITNSKFGLLEASIDNKKQKKRQYR